MAQYDEEPEDQEDDGGILEHVGSPGGVWSGPLPKGVYSPSVPGVNARGSRGRGVEFDRRLG